MTRKIFAVAISTLAIAFAFLGPISNTAEAQNNLPVIFNFTPASAPPGTLVSISGRNLGGARSVRFNSANAQFRVITSDFIQAVVPAGAGTGPIFVTTPFGTARSGAFFTSTQQGGPIEIQFFSPVAGRAGTQVTITGRNFANAGTRA
ncbi:MAG: IPT/TIG domain-containing protein, partial [Acidobacteriota bacterium]